MIIKGGYVKNCWTSHKKKRSTRPLISRIEKHVGCKRNAKASHRFRAYRMAKRFENWNISFDHRPYVPTESDPDGGHASQLRFAAPAVDQFNSIKHHTLDGIRLGRVWSGTRGSNAIRQTLLRAVLFRTGFRPKT